MSMRRKRRSILPVWAKIFFRFNPPTPRNRPRLWLGMVNVSNAGVFFFFIFRGWPIVWFIMSMILLRASNTDEEWKSSKSRSIRYLVPLESLLERCLMVILACFWYLPRLDHRSHVTVFAWRSIDPFTCRAVIVFRVPATLKSVSPI